MVGRACRLRVSEGPACRGRGTVFDNPYQFIGRDEHAPTNGHNEGASRTLGGTCLSGPLRFRLRSLNSGNNWRSVRIHGKLKILGELGRFACLMPIVGRANDTFLGEAEKALVHPNRGWNLERFTPQFLVFKRVRTDVRGKNYLESGRGER